MEPAQPPCVGVDLMEVFGGWIGGTDVSDFTTDWVSERCGFAAPPAVVVVILVGLLVVLGVDAEHALAAIKPLVLDAHDRLPLRAQ